MTNFLRSRAFAALLAVFLAACDPATPPVCKVPEADSDAVAAARSAGELTLDAKLLPALLFDGNLPIHLATNRIHQAKAELARARAELFPSLNLGALLMAAGQPQFAWTGIQAVVPFLIPGNWFRARQASVSFEAEKMALQIVEQNQYASSFSAISIWMLDRRLLGILEAAWREAAQQRQRAEQSFRLGLLTAEDRDRFIADENRAEISVARIRELLEVEEASIRRLFGLAAGTKLGLDEASFEVVETDSERWSVDAAVERAMRISPESNQLARIEEAARAGRWSSVFAFMGGVTLSQNADQGNLSFSMKNLSANGGLQFGVSYFPAIEISNRNIRELELRREEMGLEFQEVFEGLRARLESGRVQVKRFSELKGAVASRYEAMKLRVELGLAEPWELLDLEGQLRQASLDLIRASAELGLVRVTWQRSLQEGAFAALSPCMVDEGAR